MQEYFETLRTEFRSEVELLAKIEHRNLVKLLGYVERGNERLIITEYVPNGTLREHLDGKAFKLRKNTNSCRVCRLTVQHLTDVSAI